MLSIWTSLQSLSFSKGLSLIIYFEQKRGEKDTNLVTSIGKSVRTASKSRLPYILPCIHCNILTLELLSVK